MKKKLVVFHPALAPYRIDLFNALNEKFDAVFYFSLDNLKDQKFNQDKLQTRIQFKFNLLTFGIEFLNRSIRFGIWHKLYKDKPNIVICSEYGQITQAVLLFKYLFDKNLQVFTMCDDSYDLSIKSKWVRKKLRNINAKILDGVILPSRKVCNWYNEHLNNTLKTLELPIIHANDVFRIELQNTFSLSEEIIKNYNLVDKKIFVFVGRLVDIKNIEFLLKSFSKASIIDGLLIIIGEGVNYNNLKYFIESNNLENKILLLGRKEGDELLAWYNIANCLILPSVLERYGAVVNEALLSGCKVLCSELAGAAVLINEKNGYVFDPYNESQLTFLIEKISKSLIPIQLPLQIKPDLMPFLYEDKINTLCIELEKQK